jgi:uncharacterized protein with NRDE domain
MCSILFAYQQHPKYPLIVVANRDEFYQRPTKPAHWWEEHPEMLAGKDILGEGSWFGVSKLGRFAALTNYRDGVALKANAPTRGKLVTDYLTQEVDGVDFLNGIAENAALYNGYNLLTFDGKELLHYSNVNNQITRVTPGVHGVSNALLNSDWPKINKGKAALEKLIRSGADDFGVEEAFQMMLDKKRAADEDLPSTGVPLEWERLLSSLYIQSDNYGTRCSTVLLWDNDGQMYFEERSYVPNLGVKSFKL